MEPTATLLQLQELAFPREICGRQSATGAGFPPDRSVVPLLIRLLAMLHHLSRRQPCCNTGHRCYPNYITAVTFLQSTPSQDPVRYYNPVYA